ncbi:hypothetical protein [Clostridium frigoris]|uniref:hypothetical protein n=1 Tax=Clostridium frigoris TaxID=205327 RepID=UPI001FE2D2FE|nr:hypothetical protein [Clostridium frigoris]
MKKYFINSELKISTVTLLFIMTLFLIITSLSLKSHHDNLKNDYIKSLGAIAQRVVAKDPKMEKEIIPLITKEVSKEEATRGKFFLKEYGLTEDLEDELFPYVSTTIIKNNYSTILIFVFMSTILLVLNYFQYSFFIKGLEN